MFSNYSSWRIKSRSTLMIVSVLVLTLTSACNPASYLAAGDPTAVSVGSDEVDAYIDSLPSWTSVSPEEPENNGIPTGKTPVSSEERNQAGDLYTCITTQYTITKNPTEIAMVNPDASVLWPGALIRGSSHLQNASLELLAVSQEKRAPLGISIQGGGVLGIQSGVSTIVDQPVGSTIREGINQLVANALGADVVVGKGFSSFISIESYSSTQTLLRLGLDARYLNSAVSANLNFNNDIDQHTFTAYFIQRLFTVSINLPDKPSSLFSSSMTALELKSLGVGPDNLPLYVDSVSYGRILMFSFTSSDTRQKIEAALEYSYNSPVGGVDIYSAADLQKTLSNARIEVFALGGSDTGVQNLIREGNLVSYFMQPLAINQVEPISFTLRNLGDNRFASVASATDYAVKECTPAVSARRQPVQ